MQLSNHVVLLPSGKEVCIDLKYKKGCRINFITGDFAQQFQSVFIKINLWAFLDNQSLENQDESRIYMQSEILPLMDFKYNSNLITIDRIFDIPHAYKIDVLYENPDQKKFPQEIELSYSVL
jgi:hypothetical protein